MAEQDLRLSDQLLQYVDKHSLRESKHLCQLRQKTCQDVEFPHMLSAPASMQFIQLLLQLMQAEQVLELGVYTGYSTLAMAEVLPQNGRVVALDHSTVWPEVGKPFWQQAGVADKIDLRIGNATECLQALVEQHDAAIFDFIYVDADKINYQNYLELSYSLLRTNGLMVFDDTLFVSSGHVVTPTNPSTRAMDSFNQQLHQDARFDLSLLTVYKGLTILRKR